VYCAGGDPNYQPFLANPVSVAEDLLQRNCLVLMRLCHHFAGHMVERGRGGIVNFTSGAALAGGRNMVAYGATKAFDMVFTEGLWVELHDNLVEGDEDYTLSLDNESANHASVGVAIDGANDSVTTTIVVIALTSWAGTTRLVRAQTLSVQGRPYLERARALGAGHWHQMTRHILPNVLPLVLASATLLVPSAILTESALAWLGLGDPNVVSWGSILNRAWRNGAVSAGAWWYLLPPGFAILIVVSCFMMCGRALEAVINPRLRGESS
jgi:hypothetical protein